MMKKIGLIILALTLIGCMACAQAESAGMEILEEMDYIVGLELEPGEYILVSLPGQTGSFHLAADLYDRQTIAEEEFETNTIVTVDEDEYLIITSCIGVRAEDFYAHMRIGSGQYGTMLKVGYDLQPGKYRLEVAPGKVGHCRIFSSSRHAEKDLINEYQGGTLPEIQVAVGQYIQLIDSRVVGGDTSSTYEQLNGIAQASNAIGTVVIQEGKNPSVRSTPSTDGEKIGKAESGKQYMLLDSDARWYKILLEDGTAGWIVNYYAEVVD